METGLGVLLSYLACAGLFQANSRRTTIQSFRFPDGDWPVLNRRLVLSASWALIIVSLLLFSAPQGFERGVPIWLGVLGLAGFITLFIAAIKPSLHMPISVITAACVVLMLIVWAAGSL